MSLENVKKYLSTFGVDKHILEFSSSSATVKLAAMAIGTDEAKIAKSLTFWVDGNVVMVVCAGDVKIDNSKFKAVFQTKAKMLSFDEVEKCVGHEVGGVCPFAISDNVRVYLDESLKRFDFVYPACGSSNSAIKLCIAELKQYCQNFCGFIDVTKKIEE